ncbi:uncharacterized protein LOC127260909 [Andrographis paniculata]|uniref:uncharacterized protein LOC127260909 n=1 Tax=Andrographis paniculata TaxID=175694 RepID=UPI0021E82154|nr:uncharacterized protein LOC127260909 [Andrographis paniculata]
MTSILTSRPWLPAVRESFNFLRNGADCRFLCFGCSNQDAHVRATAGGGLKRRRSRHSPVVFAGKLEDGAEEDDGDSEAEHDAEREDSEESGSSSINSDILRANLERIVGSDDSSFSGIDLATLIRNKYGRSYDVQLIKKEFMGRNLLALNVMWKYMEQRSFPLTEEEYILRLDGVANTLKCWGAVSHVRNSLQKLKERPRIGKAVSIFIDMDESGGRAKEWIYK